MTKTKLRPEVLALAEKLEAQLQKWEADVRKDGSCSAVESWFYEHTSSMKNMIYNAIDNLSQERTVDELHKSISESLERAHNIADKYLTPLAPKTKGTKQ